MKIRPAGRFHPRLELLEPRRLMVSGLAASLNSAGVLSIMGTNAADTINLHHIGNSISIDTVATTFNYSQVKQILIDALGGDDRIRLDGESFAGQQSITAASVIYGRAGNDYIVGGQGADWIFGGDGLDQIWGNAGDDLLDGGLGNDLLVGNAGIDQVFGDLGDDQLWGSEGNDRLVGGEGADRLYGGDGNDDLDGSRGADALDGGAGTNRLFDDVSGNTFTNSSGAGATVNGHFGWFDMNTQDAALRTLARTRFLDNSLDRNDMLSLLRQTEADGNVAEAELSDLRAMVTPTAGAALGMLDYVRDLSNKVVNPHIANGYYQGESLPTLRAGATGVQLEKLVGKWFLGTDRPLARDEGGTVYGYRWATGSLFVNGAAYADINQGYLGDCYFLATLAETAFRTPKVISNMFIDNGDGTYTVRFYKYGVADYLTVDRNLPADAAGRLVFASAGKLAASSTTELWVALAEKAYVQLCGQGWARPLPQGTTLVAYNMISGGLPSDAIKQVTGRQTAWLLAPNFNDVVAAFNQGQIITFASKHSGLNNNSVVPGHAYALVGYNASTKKFTLFNPWGVNNTSKPGLLTLTWSQIAANFGYWDKTI